MFRFPGPGPPTAAHCWPPATRRHHHANPSLCRSVNLKCEGLIPATEVPNETARGRGLDSIQCGRGSDGYVRWGTAELKGGRYVSRRLHAHARSPVASGAITTSLVSSSISRQRCRLRTAMVFVPRRHVAFLREHHLIHSVSHRGRCVLFARAFPSILVMASGAPAWCNLMKKTCVFDRKIDVKYVPPLQPQNRK